MNLGRAILGPLPALVTTDRLVHHLASGIGFPEHLLIAGGATVEIKRDAASEIAAGSLHDDVHDLVVKGTIAGVLIPLRNVCALRHGGVGQHPVLLFVGQHSQAAKLRAELQDAV